MSKYVNIYDVLELHFYMITSYHIIYIPIELINFTCKENKEEEQKNILTHFCRHYCSEFVFVDKVVELYVFLIKVVFLLDKV